MFPGLQEQTDTARVQRAIDQLKACTVEVDLERVWKNCQPLCDHLHTKAKAGSQEAATLLKRLADVSCDVRQGL
jgi:hypothetical protein